MIVQHASNNTNEFSFVAKKEKTKGTFLYKKKGNGEFHFNSPSARPPFKKVLNLQFTRKPQVPGAIHQRELDHVASMIFITPGKRQHIKHTVGMVSFYTSMHEKFCAPGGEMEIPSPPLRKPHTPWGFNGT